MRNRLVFRGFAGFGALVCVAVLTATATAQPAPVQVVQGSDGTLYVVQGSNSWTLVPDQISDADVATLSPSGEIDGILPSELLIVQAPTAPQAPAPATAQQPAPAPAPPPPPPPVPAPPAPVPGPPQVTVQSPNEGQNVSAKGGQSFTISGSATDPTAGPGGIDVVDVWIFGERNTNGATDLGTATVLSDGSWSLTFLPTRFTSTHTNIYVYAHSRTTSLETELVRGFNIVG